MSTVRRPFVGNGQYGLFTLLLIIILSAVTVNGRPDFNLENFLRNKGINATGDSVKEKYLLVNKCSGKYVQMKFGGRRGRINARGDRNNRDSQLVFLSLPRGKIMIQGAETKKYLCFNRKGRLVLRRNRRGKRCEFQEKRSEGNFLRLRSEINKDWYVGFRRNGKRLPGYAKRNPKKEKCFDFIRSKVRPLRTDGPLEGVDPRKLLESIKDQTGSEHR